MKKTLFLVLMNLFISSLTIGQSNLVLDACLKPFYHGVSSGDPLEDRVIIWTRVTPDNLSVSAVTGTWEVASDINMTKVVKSGDFTTNSSKDFTVKIDVVGLSAQTYYYYQFTTNGVSSPVGRTKTAPSKTETNARFGVVSCANLEGGFFNVYKAMNEKNDLDAVICLGDYIYEYETGGYSPNPNTQRFWEPKTETTTLSDYRARYSVYRLDPDLRRNHQLFPWICVWDDHETANDSWVSGAQNHSANEGNWETRKNAGRQAYFEWLPIRQTNPNDPYQIYREINYGSNIDLIMLDTRLEGREKQSGTTGTTVTNANRKLISETQKNWMTTKIKNSTAKWKFIAQQVMMAPVRFFGAPFNGDQWNGYPAERTNLVNFVTQNNINNLIILTGDIHTSWANDLPKSNYNATTGAGSWGVEFITPSVTSPGGPVGFIAAGNNFVKYVEGSKRGYVSLDITADRVQSDWNYVSTINASTFTTQIGASWLVKTNENRLTKASSPAIASTTITSISQPSKCNTTIATRKSIDETTLKIVSLYPNPADAFFTIHYNVNKPGKIKLKINDLTGKTIKEFETEKYAGIWTERYPTANIPAGNYIVTIVTEGYETSQRMIISH